MADVLIESRELPQMVARNLREMIFANHMKPGDRLPSEGELVAMFGVGRSTVREAVKLLIADNIVEIRRGRGTFITMNPGIKDDPLGLNFANQKKLLQNLLESRMLIEPQIASLAAQRATDENLYSMSRSIEEMEHAEARGEGYIIHESAFHTTVAESTQNDVLQRILPIILESIREGFLETIDVPTRHKRAIESHIRIFEAIRNKDPEDAMEQTRLHILQAMDDTNLLGGMKK